MTPLEHKILELVQQHPLATYQWKDRGRAPIGYLKGMALVYARMYAHLKRGVEPVVKEATKPGLGNSWDALVWYDLGGTDNPIVNLHNLFALMIGLGMRESTGKFCCGRDMSANNMSATNAEAGLFQMSWDITHGSPDLYSGLVNLYSQLPEEDGLGAVFHEGVHCYAVDHANHGEGPGATYQMLAKAKPAFAVECAAIGLRNRRNHWGPINRKEVEVRPEALALLRQITALIESNKTLPVPAPVKSKSWLSRFLGFLVWLITGRKP